MGTSFYKYTALSRPNNIRLLRLTGIRNGHVDCDLVESMLDDVDQLPNYTAISYHWGDGERSETVAVNSSWLRVTKNAAVLLHHLADQRSLDDDPPFWWIDALCINQDDIREKGLQIPMMGQIFSRATETLVWLGERSEADQSDLALYHCGSLTSILLEIEETAPPGMGLSAPVPKALGDSLHREALLAIGLLLKRPWFRRLWVIQEVALSKKIIVACGLARARWEDITTCISLLTEKNFLSLLGNKVRLRPSSVGNLATMERLRQCLCRKDNGLDLIELISVSRPFLATEPKDYVFGLVGMIRQEDLDRLHVGYEDTKERVFQNTTEICLSSGHSFETLAAAGIQFHVAEATMQMPSWVSDLSYLAGKDVDIPFGMQAPGVKPEYHAGTEVPNTLNVEHPVFSESLMKVNGLVLDRITATSAPMSGRSSTSDTIRWAKEVIDLADQFRTLPNVRPLSPIHDRSTTAAQNESSSPHEEALSRTLCADQRTDGSKAPAEWHSNFTLWKSYFLNTSAENVHDMMNELMSRNPPLPFDDDRQKAFAFLRAVEFHVSIRYRFCVTDQGHFGLVPSGTEIGDQIAIIVGANVPFVVRSSVSTKDNGQPRWQLVGSAFCHGLMYGEALAAAKTQSLTFE